MASPLESRAVRAVVCHALGDVEGLRVEDVSEPEPAPGQVLLRVLAAGVNYVDGLIVQGRYQIRPDVPYVPGGELVGVVERLGPGVDTPTPGRRVVALSGFGAWAERVAIAASSAVTVPEELDISVAATLTQAYSTARFALCERADLRPGERVLVLGGGGGVGMAAINLASALGARVVATGSTPEKRAAAELAGAESTIDPGKELAQGADTRAHGRGGGGRGLRSRGRRPRRAGAAHPARRRPLPGDRLRLERHPATPPQPGAAPQPLRRRRGGRAGLRSSGGAASGFSRSSSRHGRRRPPPPAGAGATAPRSGARRAPGVPRSQDGRKGGARPLRPGRPTDRSPLEPSRKCGMTLVPISSMVSHHRLVGDAVRVDETQEQVDAGRLVRPAHLEAFLREPSTQALAAP